MITSAKRYTIVIIEPSQIIELGIRKLLENTEFDIIRSFGSHPAFSKDYFQGTSPDIILVNPTLLQPHKQFLVRSFFSDFSETVFVALLYSFVPPESTADFDGSIHIYDQRAVLLKKLRRLALSTPKHLHSQKTKSTQLSEREKEILVAVVKGLTNKEVAEAQNISIHTVISHRKNITRKTGIKTISGLLMYALFNSLITAEEIR